MLIAIVNDLPLAVEAIRQVLLRDGSHEIAWVAYDGVEAVECCRRDRPDLILMDLIMPRMDGVEATRRIMSQTPCAILIVTANVTDNQGKVFEAMGAGALDVTNTPVLHFSESCKGADALLAKVEMLGKLVGTSNSQRSDAARGYLRRLVRRADCLIAIGASAGGPSALARILANLPEGFPAAIVIVQHVDSQFAPGLASWLDYQTPLTVRLAREGELIQNGTVLLAAGDDHLVFNGPGRVGYVQRPLQGLYRPSIDAFFNSIDKFWEGQVIGVLLTGMGRDGAEGLRLLRQGGHHTLVQDQPSSAVFGMPKAAIELAAADEILPLERIAPRLVRLVTHRNRQRPALSIDAES
jgi:two-component system response regulator WspF